MTGCARAMVEGMNGQPQCPKCDTRDSLERIGHGWYFCTSCAKRVLFDADGRYVRDSFQDGAEVPAVKRVGPAKFPA